VRKLLTTGAALGAVACGFLALWHDRQWQVAFAAGVFGLGIGLAFASMANLIVGSVPAEQTGAATGMNANIRTIGAAVTSVLVTGRLQPSGLPYASGYSHGFSLLALLCLAAALAALLVPVQRAGRISGTPRASGDSARTEPEAVAPGTRS
jgi:MFS family permease